MQIKQPLSTDMVPYKKYIFVFVIRGDENLPFFSFVNPGCLYIFSRDFFHKPFGRDRRSTFSPFS